MAGVDDDLVVDPCQLRVRLDVPQGPPRVRSDSEDLGLAGCELLIGEDALSVKVRQVLELRGRVVLLSGGGGAAACCAAYCWGSCSSHLAF